MRMLILLMMTGVFLMACKPEDAGKLALLSDTVSAERQAEASLIVRQRIAEALSASSVLLAPDAFYKQSDLSIERKPHRAIDSKPLGGLILGEPDRFELRKRGRHCALVHLNTGTIYRLKGVSCRINTD